jgi:hypothetical protein
MGRYVSERSMHNLMDYSKNANFIYSGHHLTVS